MKIFRSAQIREIDQFTIKNEPVKSIDLMERAASKITDWIVENISQFNRILVFAGPGNNGGDALVVARQLIKSGFEVQAYLLKLTDKLSPDCEINLQRLTKECSTKIYEITTKDNFPEIPESSIIIDGIFGSGLSRKTDGLAKDTISFINKSNTTIISIDIPSGLFGEDNSDNNPEGIIKATYTLTLQFPKLSYFFPENEDYVGQWKILPIGLHAEIINSTPTPYHFVCQNFITTNLKKRKKFSHKGTFGHALLISGSYGKMGAAVLAAKACLRTGSGLVTVHVPKLGNDIIQTALPEAMVSIDQSELIFTEIENPFDYDALGIGPGIGTKPNTVRGLAALLNNYSNPLVIDADAINILSQHNELIQKIPKNSILTPHPKEFERLAGNWKNDYDRLQKQINFATKNGIFVVLKGAHTSIACPDGDVYFNTTGNPGMATAGSGDVLTGIILSLLGQKYEPKFAAIIGVYLHGLAGDLAAENLGEEALIASDIIENLGIAYLKIKNKF